MGYAIIRIEKRKAASAVSGMLKHALREAPVANALPGAPPPVLLAGSRTTPEAMKRLQVAIRRAKEEKVWRADTVRAVDILVTSSNEDLNHWPVARQDEYFRLALAFVAERFGGMDNVLAAAVHRDESTPHMQVLMMPVDALTGRFQLSKIVGGPAGLVNLQDGFWEACGKPFGLLRGESGSKAKHVPVKALYAAMNQAMDIPQAIPVPPEPGMTDRLKPDYQAKKKAREDALEHNRRVQKQILALAHQGRAMHPTLVARQADKYREAKRLEKLSAARLVDAQKLEDTASRRLVLVDGIEKRATETLRAVDHHAGAKLIDKFSKHLAPAFVATLASALGIELQAGKGLCDQVRRAGLASNLLEAAQLLEKAGDGQILNAAQSWQRRQESIRDDTPRLG